MRALPLQIGDVIAGKYRLIRMLGEGGMGAVFEAENTLTMKRVALKLLPARGTRPSARPATSLPSSPVSGDRPISHHTSLAPRPRPPLRGFVAIALATGAGAVLAIAGQALLAGSPPSEPAAIEVAPNPRAVSRVGVPIGDAGVSDPVQATDALAAPLARPDAGVFRGPERPVQEREPTYRSRADARRRQDVRQDVVRAPAAARAAPAQRPGSEKVHPVQLEPTEPPPTTRQKGALRVDDFVFPD